MARDSSRDSEVYDLCVAGANNSEIADYLGVTLANIEDWLVLDDEFAELLDRGRLRKYPELTPKQELFVAEYLVDFNASRAARAAGYSPNTAERIGSDNIRKPHIAKIIEEKLAERAEGPDKLRERILRELACLAFADVSEIVTIEEHPHPADPSRTYKAVNIKTTADIPRELRPAIQSIKQGAHGIEIKLYDKSGPINQLMKYLGMDVNKVELTGAGGGPLQVVGEMSDADKLKLLMKAVEHAKTTAT